jgi:hypothetical protein
MSELKRRATDAEKGFIGKLVDDLTPWHALQALGFLILCAYMVTHYSDQFNAYASTLTDHESRLRTLENATSQMTQEVHDLHNWLGKDRVSR